MENKPNGMMSRFDNAEEEMNEHEDNLKSTFSKLEISDFLLL